MKGLLQAAVQLQSFFLNHDWPFWELKDDPSILSNLRGLREE